MEKPQISINHQTLNFEEVPKSGGLRWAVGSPSGRRSSTWRIWGNKKGDVYLSVRALGGILKVSLHKDRRCQVGFTSEYAEEATSKFGTTSRHWSRWTLLERPVVRAIQIVFPDQDLAFFETDDSKQMRWLPAPGPGHATVVSIFIAEPPESCNWSRPEQDGHLIGVLACPSRFTWVVHTNQKIDEELSRVIDANRATALQHAKAGAVPLDTPGLRMILWGHTEGPADVFFIELNASDESANKDPIEVSAEAPS